MTVLSLPDQAKIRSTNFRLQRMQAVNPLRGGNHQAVDLGEAVWLCDIETTPLSREQGGAWKWLLAKLRGALRTLYLYDASRSRPLEYLEADSIEILASSSEDCSSTWILASCDGEVDAWGSPKISAVDRTNGELDLIGLKPGAVISEGDMGAWDDGPARRLHILGGGTADATGALTVSVEPVPPATATEALPCAFLMEKPAGEFVVLQAQAPYSAPVTHQVTLQAAQVLRRS